jgi:hypothetical protein
MVWVDHEAGLFCHLSNRCVLVRFQLLQQTVGSSSGPSEMKTRISGLILIFIYMACHCLTLKDQREFFRLMKERDSDLILKMVKCVLSAYKRNKDGIDIFDITFKDMSGMVFNIEKSQYTDLLSNCLNDLIAIEEYELCAEVKKIIDKKSKKKYGDALELTQL